MRYLLRSTFYGIASLALSLIIFALFVSGLLFALIGVYEGDAVFGALSAMALSLSSVFFLASVSHNLTEDHPGEHARVIPIVHD